MSFVSKVTAGGATHLVGSSLYGTCATAAATAAKVVTLSDFDQLITGVTIHVKFTYANTVANPTLNVNSTGAKNIYRYGTTAPSTNAATSWQAGSVVSFTYDGSAWQMNDWLNDNTTYSNMSQTEAETGTATNARSISAKVLKAAIDKHSPDITDMLNMLGAKNLIPHPYTNGSTTLSGLAFTDNSDGSLLVNGTATADVYYAMKNNSAGIDTWYLPAGTYILSLEKTSGTISDHATITILVRTSQSQLASIMFGASETYRSADFTLSSRTEVNIRISFASGEVCTNALFKPMIRPASITDTTWVPYAMTNKELTDKVTFVKVAGTTCSNYKNAGIYYFNSSYAPTDIPSGVNGWLIVLPNEGNGTIKQIWLRHGTATSNSWNTYERLIGTTVGTWTRFYTNASGDKVAIANGGTNATTVDDAKVNLGISERSCIVGQSGSTTTNPWYKAASISMSAANTDSIIMFAVNDTYYQNNGGILKIRVRTDANKAMAVADIRWLTHTGYDLNDFVLAYSSGNPLVVELWTKIALGYMGRRFTILSEGNRTDAFNKMWTLYNTYTGGSAAAPTSGYTQVKSTNYLSNDIIPYTNNSINLGSSSNKFNNIYVGNLNADSLILDGKIYSSETISCDDTVYVTHAEGGFAPTDGLILSHDERFSSGYNWRMYVNDINNNNHPVFRLYYDIDEVLHIDSSTFATYINGDTDVNGTMKVFQSLLPFNDNYSDSTLGNASKRWKQLYASTATINTSDERLKRDIQEFDNDFVHDFIMGLKPVSYYKVNGDRPHYGLIAQDVEETLNDLGLTTDDFGGITASPIEDPESVKGTEMEGLDEVYGLRYEEFISPLIRMVQIQQKEIEVLKQQVNELKGK